MAALMLTALAALAALLAALVRIAHDRSCLMFASPTFINGTGAERFRQFPYHPTEIRAMGSWHAQARAENGKRGPPRISRYGCRSIARIAE
jgi:hypothetical protein